MLDFNYQKAYCVLALPAFHGLNQKQRNAHSKLIPLVGELRQEGNLEIPMSDAIKAILNELSSKELAELSRTSYFAGHWQPSLLEKPFNHQRGESWKIANCCDQVLRERLKLPYNVEIHEGKLRKTFSGRDYWLWDEFGLATEKNMEIYKSFHHKFNEDTLEHNVKDLATLIGDLWPNVDDLPANKDYKRYLELYKQHRLQKLAESNNDRLKKLEEDIEVEKFKYIIYKEFLNKDIDIDNCIYYSHLKTFCFGWRDKITQKQADIIKSKLKDFPHKIEFKIQK